MGGLLYKDFISINRIGKVKATWVYAIITLVFLVLRITFPGTGNNIDFIVTNEQGETVNMMDVFFLMFFSCQILTSLSFVSAGKIMGNDDKNKIKGYLATMPLEKNAYVASKYVFIGIAAYVAMSLDYVWGISYAAFCREGMFQNIANYVNSFIVSIICIAILLAAIELPLYFSVGKEKAMRAMVVFWTAIALVVIGYLMFGNLTIIENWDITVLIDFMERHQTGVILFQAMEPVMILALYYLSYRLSCYLFNKREAEF